MVVESKLLMMNRSEPALSLSLSLIVFVVTPDDDGGARVGTIGGEIVSPRGLDGFDPRSQTLSDYVTRAMRWNLPPGTVTSRIRPLMPRLSSPTSVLLPLWTTGRIADFDSSEALPSGGRLNALERLAETLRDATLVTEANSEFRRALAADPLSHQMLGEGARLRALAMDELARESMADELPPIFALLPEVFTIEHLRSAISQVAHRPELEAESSSNFRRRIMEFLKYGVLVEVGDFDVTRQKGRPAMRYRFAAHAWRRWLSTRSTEPTMREMHQLRSDFRVSRSIDHSESHNSPSDMPAAPRVFMQLDAEAVREVSLNQALPLPPDVRPNQLPFSPAVRATELPDTDRVKQLEQMVMLLASRFDAERGKLDAVLRAVQQNAQKPVDMPNDKAKDQ